MYQRKRLNANSRRAYVEGMKHYQEEGVRVLIDGKDANDELWEKIFEVRQDGGFYMGDYVFEEVSIPIRNMEHLPEAAEAAATAAREEADRRTLPQPDFVKDPPGEYGTKKKLKEIRFDIVYHR